MSEASYTTVWNNCLQIVKDNIPPQSFKTWFEPIKAVKLTGSILTIAVPTHFFIEFLEEYYIDLISKALKRELGRDAKLEYNVKVISNEKPVQIPHQSTAEITNKTLPFPNQARQIANPFVIPGLQQLKIDPQLNPHFSFENFIEGECNRLARSAGLTIASNPGSSAFNPLFLYGGSGLGKTHLAQAIGINIKERFPDKIVLYVSANRFQTQFMDAVNVKNKLTDFLHFYQMIDVLIIDDVQEFAGKTGTQNTFFNIFNHLHQTGKQLVLTSDRSPVVMVGLEQRLLTRFKWGLSAEIEKPDFQLRKAILENKIYRDGLEIPADVVDFIAENVTDNVRDLEGTLVSLLAHSTLADMPLDVELAEKIVSRIVTVTRKTNTVEKIRDTVCDYFSLSVDAISTKSRKREVVQARQIAMYLSKQLTKNSLSSIGLAIGQRDHATVLHACKIVTDLMDIDKNFRLSVNEIQEKLKR